MPASAPGSGSLRTALPQVRAVFQPIVDLDSLDVVAYEALARGPVGIGPRVARPRSSGRRARPAPVAELDWVCRAAAYRGAACGPPRPSMALFVNVEPSRSTPRCRSSTASSSAAAAERFRVVLEITERSITDRPAELLAIVDRARAPRLRHRARRRRRRRALARAAAVPRARRDQARHVDGPGSARRPQTSRDRRRRPRRPPRRPARRSWPRASRRPSTWHGPARSARGSARGGCSAGPQAIPMVLRSRDRPLALTAPSAPAPGRDARTRPSPPSAPTRRGDEGAC